MKKSLQTLAAVVLLVSSFMTQAATIQPVSVTDMISQSRLIVDASVIDIRTESTPQTSAIHTIVTFQIHEVLKGEQAATVLELSFLGGISDGAGMMIPGLIYPELGERGVYFLENPSRAQINPIYGWDQGHFIVDDPGAGDDAMIHTIGFERIYDLRSGATPPAGFRSRVAAGIDTTPSAAGARPMTIGDFKSSLRLLIAELEKSAAVGTNE